jgi:hypothetical protein
LEKLVWRVKLVAETAGGPATEIEVARIERDPYAQLETLGLTLEDGKRIAAAIQHEMVQAQASVMGENFRYCGHCRSRLPSKGYRSTTFRSLYGDVPLRVRRFVGCRCLPGRDGPKTLSALALEGGLSPELAYVTAKFAAVAPFARAAGLLAELLPVGGAINASTVRNRTHRGGRQIARLPPVGVPFPEPDATTSAVVIGLDGGYLRSRHRRPERNFEVIAGKVLDLNGSQHRFAFARNGNSENEFAEALVSAGIRQGTSATVLSDGDAGLWKLQRRVMPDATVVLDWWHIATRFEHALQAARGLGAGTDNAHLRSIPIREFGTVKWKLWHGRTHSCLGRLGHLLHWLDRRHVRDARGASSTRKHVVDLVEYLHANRRALVDYRKRRHDGLAISTAFVESAVNEILSKRMIKKQQMRWNRWTVQPFLDVRIAVLNNTLRGSFQRRYPAFQVQNDNFSQLTAA